MYVCMAELGVSCSYYYTAKVAINTRNIIAVIEISALACHMNVYVCEMVIKHKFYARYYCNRYLTKVLLM